MGEMLRRKEDNNNNDNNNHNNDDDNNHINNHVSGRQRGLEKVISNNGGLCAQGWEKRRPKT